MGLTTMRERAGVLDGTCEVTSGPLKGTTVEATVPLREAQAGFRNWIPSGGSILSDRTHSILFLHRR